MTDNLEVLVHSLGLEVERGSRGKWVIPEHLAATLRDADRLMKGGAGTATIRRVLGVTITPQAPDAAAAEDAHGAPCADREDIPVPERAAGLERGEAPLPARSDAVDAELLDRATSLPGVHEMAGLVAASVADVVKGETELAEKYARAAFEVGELRATVKARDERLALMAAELAEMKAELHEARALLAAPLRPARPWWRFWG